MTLSSHVSIEIGNQNRPPGPHVWVYKSARIRTEDYANDMHLYKCLWCLWPVREQDLDRKQKSKLPCSGVCSLSLYKNAPLLDMVLGRTTYQIHVLDQLEKERNSKLLTCNLVFGCPLTLKPTLFVVMAIKFITTATNVLKCRTGRGMTFQRKKNSVHSSYGNGTSIPSWYTLQNCASRVQHTFQNLNLRWLCSREIQILDLKIHAERSSCFQNHCRWSSWYWKTKRRLRTLTWKDKPFRSIQTCSRLVSEVAHYYDTLFTLDYKTT
jgi:hypothetical protein